MTMKIFCDDGSTSTKLAYFQNNELVKVISDTSFNAGNWNFAYGKNIFNYEINGKKYSFNDALSDTSETTNIDYQYSDENLAAVHHALLQTGLKPCEIDLFVTLPLCEFFDENRQKNNKNIERKKANLLREIKYHNGESFIDTFKIKNVNVSPESLTALYDVFDKHKVSDFETSLIIDLGGTTLDCGVVSGNFKQLVNVIAEPTLGTSFVTNRAKKIVKYETNLGLSYSTANNLVMSVFNDDYDLLNAITGEEDTIKTKKIISEIISALDELSIRVINKLKTLDEFQRIYLIGGGAYFIHEKIKSEFSQLGNKIFLVPDSQTALVESIAKMVGE
ncbi:plasmid segregation protein ParM domain-containing protein [Proteus mirabilis]|uniref:plasmid segregation protein ParM domain-containing protein n=1 Tax=Proteus mirabilis TaxID=584 RepID=UPI0034D54C4A